MSIFSKPPMGESSITAFSDLSDPSNAPDITADIRAVIRAALESDPVLSQQTVELYHADVLPKELQMREGIAVYLVDEATKLTDRYPSMGIIDFARQLRYVLDKRGYEFKGLRVVGLKALQHRPTTAV